MCWNKWKASKKCKEGEDANKVFGKEKFNWRNGAEKAQVKSTGNENTYKQQKRNSETQDKINYKYQNENVEGKNKQKSAKNMIRKK